MNKYIATEFSNGFDDFWCLFKADNIQEIEYDDDNELSYDYGAKYDIIEILVGNDKLKVRKNDLGFYEWRSYLPPYKYLPGLIGIDWQKETFESIYKKEVKEFQDNESALLWFKLEYGSYYEAEKLIEEKDIERYNKLKGE
jgi:hypothetical protein